MSLGHPKPPQETREDVEEGCRYIVAHCAEVSARKGCERGAAAGEIQNVLRGLLARRLSDLPKERWLMAALMDGAALGGDVLCRRGAKGRQIAELLGGRSRAHRFKEATLRSAPGACIQTAPIL